VNTVKSNAIINNEYFITIFKLVDEYIIIVAELLSISETTFAFKSFSWGTIKNTNNVNDINSVCPQSLLLYGQILHFLA